MNIGQVKDIIDWIIVFHDELSKKYHQMAEQNQSPRVQLLLDYLSDHESKLKQALTKYSSELDAAGILHTWFRQTPDPRYPKTLQDLQRCLCSMTAEEIVDMAIGFHDTLILMYQELSELSETVSVKEFFQSLSEMERHEKMRMVRDTNQLYDF